MKTRIFLALASVALASCTQQEPPTYSAQAGAYFFRGGDYYTPAQYIAQADSVNYTFVELPADQTRHELPIWVKIMGEPSTVARTIRLEQTNAGQPDAAVAGKHYVAFSEATPTIPAGASQALIKIVLLRDPSIEAAKFRLEMRIVPSAEFPLVMPDKSTFLVTTTGQYEEPARWRTLWRYYFGVWGPRKMEFIIHEVGYNDWETTVTGAYGRSLQGRAVELLKKYNATHPTPLAEADGTPVTFL